MSRVSEFIFSKQIFFGDGDMKIECQNLNLFQEENAIKKYVFMFCDLEFIKLRKDKKIVILDRCGSESNLRIYIVYTIKITILYYY